VRPKGYFWGGEVTQKNLRRGPGGGACSKFGGKGLQGGKQGKLFCLQNVRGEGGALGTKTRQERSYTEEGKECAGEILGETWEGELGEGCRGSRRVEWEKASGIPKVL